MPMFVRPATLDFYVTVNIVTSFPLSPFFSKEQRKVEKDLEYHHTIGWYAIGHLC